VQADNGVVAGANVTTTGGTLHLDGDLDDSSSADRHNTVILQDGTTLTAKTKLTLEDTSGNPGGDHVTVGGTVTLRAGSGVLLSDGIAYPGGWLDLANLVNGTESNVAGRGVGGTADTTLWRSYSIPGWKSTGILSPGAGGWNPGNHFWAGSDHPNQVRARLATEVAHPLAGTPAWIKIDLDRPVNINKVGFFTHATQRPRGIKMFYSTTFAGPYSLALSHELANIDGSATEQVVDMSAQRAQYWKLEVLSSWQWDTSSLIFVATGVIISQIRFHEVIDQSYAMSTFMKESDAASSTGWSDATTTNTGAISLHGLWGGKTKRVEKTFQLPVHSRLRVQARFWAIDSWNAGEVAAMEVCDSPGVQCVVWWSKSRASPTACTGGWSEYHGTMPNPWKDESVIEGPGRPNSPVDSPGHKCYFDIDVTMPHSRGASLPSTRSMTLSFTAGLDAPKIDEAWGFSNVTLSIDKHGHDLTINADYESHGGDDHRCIWQAARHERSTTYAHCVGYRPRGLSQGWCRACVGAWR
jgi:hypothetical protein